MTSSAVLLNRATIFCLRPPNYGLPVICYLVETIRTFVAHLSLCVMAAI